MPAAVSVRGVSKKYRIYSGGRDRLKEILSFGRRKYGRNFWALKDINLEVERGTTLGILGRNGAGKSTLLSIVAGILQPTRGTVEVNGRLVALSGTGAGFNNEFTGRENVVLNGLILGMEYQEILERFDEIAAFADIGNYMDQPIKMYSSGMRSRLGFAVAASVEPDVLILDETLAVGDMVYQEAAMQKMYELRDSGTTILFVSHNAQQVANFCTEAILLHEGRVMASGEASEVTNHYQNLASNTKTRKNQLQTGLDHEGSGEVRIRSVDILDEHLRPVETVAPDSTVTIRVNLDYLKAVKDSEITIKLNIYNPTGNRAGLEVFSASTARQGVTLKEMKQGERLIVDFTFHFPLERGAFSVTAAAHPRGSEDLYLARADEATVLQISPRDQSPFRGFLRLPTEIKVHTPEGEQRDQPA